MYKILTFKQMIVSKSVRNLLIISLLLLNICSFGQVSYRIGLDADKVTYRVFMKSVVAYSNVQAKISTAQVTVIVPHGIGQNQFQITDLKGKTVGNNQMIWGESRVDAPAENRTVDYISFGYSGSGSALLFNINAAQEIELFNFKNSGNCTGSVVLFAANDPFSTPNSVNTNPGNQMTILGFGTSNAYRNNEGGAVTCLTTSNVPDFTANITGATSVTNSTPSNYTINVNNTGTASSSGAIITNTTLPAGINYNSTSGNGWASVAVPKANGTTLITSTFTQSIAANSSATPLILSLTPSNIWTVGSTFSLNGVVSGGGEINLDNNSYTSTTSIKATTISTDLGVFARIDNPTPNLNANINITFEIRNNGLENPSSIINQITLPTGFSVTNISISSNSNYNASTGVWTLNALPAAQIAQLIITGRPTAEGVVYFAINLISTNVIEINPTNNSASACFGIPVKLCAGTNFIARIDKRFTNIQWLKNGTPIAGANTDTLLIISTGTYTFTSATACPQNGCCPLVVVPNTSTASIAASPATITSCGSYNLTNLAVTLNGSTITNGLSYYRTQADALAGTNQVGTFATQSGKYWLRFKPTNECPLVTSVDITVGSALNFTQPNPVCGRTFDLSSVQLFNNGVAVTSGIAYFGSFSTSASSSVIFPLENPVVTASGLYYATVRNANGCVSLAAIQVRLTGPTRPNIQDAVNNCPATTVNLVALQKTPSTTGGIFEWHTTDSPSSPLVNNATAVGAGTFYVFEKSSGGCISESKAVKINIQTCCKTADCTPFRLVKVKVK